MDLEVVVEGVSDVRVANEIKRKIQQVCRDTELSRGTGASSSRHQRCAASGTSACADRSAVISPLFRDPERVDQLPELVAERFRAFLRPSPQLDS